MIGNELLSAINSKYDKIYRVQVGVFSSQVDAEQLKVKLKKENIDVEIMLQDGMYQVIVGRFYQIENVNQIKKRLLELGYDVYIVEES